MTNEIILRNFIGKVWNEKDLDSINQFIHPEYRIQIDTGDPWEGKTLDHHEYEKRVNHAFNSVPDLKYSIQNAFSDGDFVAVTWIKTGTHRAKTAINPFAVKSVTTFGVTIYQFKDGRICGHNQVFDRGLLQRQLSYT